MMFFAPLLILATAHLGAIESDEGFSMALPVWVEGKEKEMNLCAGFRAKFEHSGDVPVTVKIAASTLYRVFVNGSFVGHGPARGPQGFYRMDEWRANQWLHDGVNIVAIEVAGYNANSYYVLDQPSFLQAEVISNSNVLAATGGKDNPFEARILTERIQKVQRYSFQRPFIEVYRFEPGYDLWRSDPETAMVTVPIATVEKKTILKRGVPYPLFPMHMARSLISEGLMEYGKNKHPFRDRSLTEISPKLKGFVREDLSIEVSDLLGKWQTKTCAAPVDSTLGPDSFSLTSGAFKVLDLGCNLSGFIHIEVQCTDPTRLFVTFDEQLKGMDVNWSRLGCVNALTFDLAPGTYTLEAFEPHTMRYMKLIAAEGGAVVSNPGLRLYENPEAVRAQFHCADERLNRIFEAGRTTFAQNAVDIFMDCPHRERAGWLCDSYFTARSALALCGNTSVEHNFLENFLLPQSFPNLPEGMLPMCYPSDHYDGVFIPNWSLWFVMELGEYAQRSHDLEFVALFKHRLEALFNYFARFENEDGLLEKLESWVFVEWSAANNFVQDVNYPSNMLYAGALEVAGDLFQKPDWKEKATRIKSTIRDQAGKGLFFVDNAIRENNTLKITDNRTEVCQYFAFYFGIASPETHPELWDILCNQFGANRVEKGIYPEIHPANAFIGNMLRFELLSRAGKSEQLVGETADYLMYMAERTGTLWENVKDDASLNHGFASHITVTLFRDVLGVRNIDAQSKEITLKLSDMALEHCSGKIPVEDEFLTVSWKKTSSDLLLYVNPPQGYSVKTENNTGKKLVMSDQDPT